MKTRFWIFCSLFLLLFLAFPAQAQTTRVRPGIYFDSALVIQSGETVEGDLLLFNSMLTIEKAGVLKGDLLMFNSGLDVGEGALLSGDLLAFDSTLRLDGEISGDLLTFGGALWKGDRARIDGELLTQGTLRLKTPPSFSQASFLSSFSPWGLLPSLRRMPLMFLPWVRVLGTAILLALLALTVTLFLEYPLQRTARFIVLQPILSGGLGLLTLLVAPLLILVLVITLVFIPLALLLMMALLLSLLFGWISLGLELGDRLLQLFARRWPLPWTAALGTFLLTLFTAAMGEIPCVGWLVGFTAALLGLGATFLMAFGYRLGLSLPEHSVSLPADSPPSASQD
ncbi:MAG: hypothetical protein J7555_02365 [Chloroflexi bacterium]|nr:hypothetical protein [Chloroflexota bacterium]